MVAYGIEIFSLTKHLKSTYPDFMQPWYADNTGALGMLDHLENCFKVLNLNGLEWEYLPDPTKSILVVHTKNLELGEEFRQRHGFKICTGARYIWVISRMRKPKVVGSKSAWINGREKFVP